MKGLGDEMSDSKEKIGIAIDRLGLLHRPFIDHVPCRTDRESNLDGGVLPSRL
jgi:hypothetical protein